MRCCVEQRRRAECEPLPYLFAPPTRLQNKQCVLDLEDGAAEEQRNYLRAELEVSSGLVAVDAPFLTQQPGFTSLPSREGHDTG